ncbi:MAG: hypothetical protein RMK74_13300, partial [Myxococcales bacterium]|nr:hypothetical protein [Myxococcales bacterium]
TAPRSGRVGDATSVLVHELSHVALHRASGGAPLPRWFVEGVAIHQAGEASFARTRLLWGATVAGRLLPLEDLERRFPSEPGVVDLAYAQAADFVRFLLDEEPGRLRSLLAAVRAGRSFEHAIREATGRDPDTLQRDWHGALRMRFTALPLVVTGTSLWGAAALLLVWAHLARRRRQRATLARWEREEREERAHAPAEPLLGPSLLVEPTPPREPGIPTVEYEGRSHTLH